ncbi:MAG: hypothetical protein GY820_28810 [Gammaproteobacteria bacterium]|nr:hypothetical protein [Gammaproteobacteria bacterium]
MTQLANSADKSYIENLLERAGLEEEEDSNCQSVRGEEQLANSPQCSANSDVGEDTVV